MSITPDVIADLWPLCQDGTASADTQALVDEYLREHPDVAASLKWDERSASALPIVEIQPDQEARMLNQVKNRIRLIHGLMLLAMVFTCQAFGRIIQDTTWTNSPRGFISTAVVAGIFWLAYIIALLRARRIS